MPDTVSHSALRAAQAWLRIVDLAINQRASVVCLSGDVADQDNKLWEAIGPLQEGIQRLSDAHIRTIAVSGNHDYDVLGRLADRFEPERFTLLGRGGRWERLTLESEGRPALHIDGWSFPAQRVQVSPLESYALDPATDAPILGMVHGDLDTRTTPYAPLELARLRALPPTGWLLGHIHSPRLLDESPWVLYPGSPQALDPGEMGAHGPWIVEVTDGAISLPAQHPISTAFYDTRTIDLSGVDDQPQLERALLDALSQEAERIEAQAGSELVHASLRLRLVGSTAMAHRVDGVSRELADTLAIPVGTGTLGIETVDVETIPAIDLTEYSRAHSAPGAVARLLLELEGDEISPETAKLIRVAKHALKQAGSDPGFAPLERLEMTDERARERLRRQARALLTQLIAQSQ